MLVDFHSHNGWGGLNGRTLRFVFFLLTRLIFKKKIDQELRLDTLYVFYLPVFFLRDIFFIRTISFLRDEKMVLRNSGFFRIWENLFFRILPFYKRIFFIIEKSELTIGCSVKSATFSMGRLIFWMFSFVEKISKTLRTCFHTLEKDVFHLWMTTFVLLLVI
jgi:hypothetical protein